MKHGRNFIRITQEARRSIREIRLEELRARLERGERLTVIDIREDHEWAMGRIPGAKHLARGILERDIERLVADRDAEIILYCGGGYRSALAAESLQRMGYTRVLSFFDGWSGWKRSGAPVERHPFAS